MPAVIPSIIDAALVIAPELLNVPVLGRVLIALGGHPGGDAQAIEELQKVGDKKKTDRKTRIERNNRYVLKASDAMTCVEKHLLDGALLLALGKGIFNAILGRADSAPDVLIDQIWTCIEEHVLRQDTPRVKHTGSYFARPSKGHGHGRKH